MIRSGILDIILITRCGPLDHGIITIALLITVHMVFQWASISVFLGPVVITLDRILVLTTIITDITAVIMVITTPITIITAVIVNT